MPPRYLLVAPSEPGDGWSADHLSQLTGLPVALDTPALLALASPDCHVLPMKGGIVLGTLFARGDSMRPIDVDASSELLSLARDEKALLTHFWGGYISARNIGGRVSVMRDPSGALACYWLHTKGATILASDVDGLLAVAPLPKTFDWQALAQLLYHDSLPQPQTVLEGVQELLPGFSIRSGDGVPSLSSAWSPWDFVSAHRASRASPPSEQLRETICHCVKAWGSLYRRPLVSVSGGLDSSVVAASLAAAGIKANAVTMYTDDPAGDERAYARLLCEEAGFPLFERRFAMEAIDLSASLGAHLPRPIGRAQDRAYELTHLAVAKDTHADAFFTGNGGDNVFGYSQSAAALTDRWLHEGLGRGLVRTVRDVCAHVGCNPLEAVAAAVRICRRQRSYRWRSNPAFLDPVLCRMLDDSPASHPWLVAPPGALPGKAAHIASLLRVQLHMEPGRNRHAPVIHPLLSQPIVEMCLAIQSWEWRAGGRDRAVVRDAFARDLPPQILARRSKGTPDTFCAAVITRHRETIRERLMEGQLVRQNLVATTTIEDAMRPDRMLTGTEIVRLLQLANVEGWLEIWGSRLTQPVKSPTGASGRSARHPSA